MTSSSTAVSVKPPLVPRLVCQPAFKALVTFDETPLLDGNDRRFPAPLGEEPHWSNEPLPCTRIQIQVGAKHVVYHVEKEPECLLRLAGVLIPNPLPFPPNVLVLSGGASR